MPFVKRREDMLAADKTLLEEYAGLAMTSLVNRYGNPCGPAVAADSFKLARAMVEEAEKNRNKTEQKELTP